MTEKDDDRAIYHTVFTAAITEFISFWAVGYPVKKATLYAIIMTGVFFMILVCTQGIFFHSD